MKVGIVGKGNVGTALGNGLSRAGHEVRHGHRDPREPVDEAVRWGEVIILAVPYSQVGNASKEIGTLADDKVLVDVTNAIAPDGGLAIGFTTSAAEEVQKMLPEARVVKAFNTVFARNQSSGRIDDVTLTAFLAGDDQEAKETVMQLSRDIGFEPVDCGPLSAARYLEPMAIQIISLAYSQGMGTGIGYKLVKERD